MLTSHETDCCAKLADFGLAETVDVNGLVSGNKAAGTLGYLAPEILEKKPYGTSSDIWSLGCLLYAMLTVALPFPIEKKSRASDVDYNHLDLDYLNISVNCKDLLSQLLTKDPERRLTIEQVLAHPFFFE